MELDEKQCPYCGESIKKVALKCKHCQTDLASGNTKNTNNASSNSRGEKKSNDFGNAFSALATVLIISFGWLYFYPQHIHYIKFWEDYNSARKEIEVLNTVSTNSESLLLIFKKGSNATDIQRDEALKELQSGVVVWDIKVYEVQEINKKYFIKGSEGDIRTGVAGSLGRSAAKAMLGREGPDFYGACANAVVYASGSDDESKLMALKTGDIIRIKGKVSKVAEEITRRCFLISPAVIYKNDSNEKKSEIVDPRVVALKALVEDSKLSIVSGDLNNPDNEIIVKFNKENNETQSIVANVEGKDRFREVMIGVANSGWFISHYKMVLENDTWIIKETCEPPDDSPGEDGKMANKKCVPYTKNNSSKKSTSSLTAIDKIDGYWYSSQWKYGYLLKSGIGTATSTNSPKFNVGDKVISLKSISDTEFEGEQVYKDGLFHKIKATLKPDGKLYFEGDRNVSWYMDKVQGPQ